MESVAEVWKPVVGEFSGWGYSVSSLGRVASRKQQQFKILKQSKDHSGYLRLCLRYGGAKKTVGASRLVAEAFIPGGDRSLQVNHISGEKTDNRVENLEWVTCKRNHEHAVEIGLRERIGVGHFRRKMSMRDAEAVRALRARGVPVAFLSRWFVVSKQSIRLIVNRKSYVH